MDTTEHFYRETEFKVTEIGEIPKEWSLKTIKEIANVKYGKANPKSVGDVPIVGSSGIFGGVAEPLITTPTIVIGRKGTAGSVWEINEPSWPSDTSFYLDYKQEVIQKYLFEYLSINKLTGDKAKTTLPSLQRNEIENLVIPHPPVSEQKEIAEILYLFRKASNLINNELTSVINIRQGILNKLFPNGKKLEKFSKSSSTKSPQGWRTFKMGEVAEITSGGTPSKANEEYWREGKIPWVKSGQCNDRRIIAPDDYITQKGLESSSARILERDTVLLAMVGATVGKTGILTFQGCTNQNVAGIYAKKPSELNQEFIFYMLQSRYSEFKKNKGFFIANLSFIRNLEIQIPSLDEQEKIVDILKSIDQYLELIRAEYAEILKIRSYLSIELLKGRIRVRRAL